MCVIAMWLTGTYILIHIIHGTRLHAIYKCVTVMYIHCTRLRAKVAYTLDPRVASVCEIDKIIDTCSSEGLKYKHAAAAEVARGNEGVGGWGLGCMRM